jgi:hypothetical protein
MNPDALQETRMERDKPRAKGELKSPAQREREAGHPLGTHPVGTAVGGVAGAVAAGAVAGSAGGPVGVAVGAALGAAGGALTGKLIADLIDPQMEEEYWRKHWSDHEYVQSGYTYDQDFSPAYRYGVESYMKDPERQFEEAELELSRGWGAYRGESRLDWDRARLAALDAWQRARDLAERGT